MKIITAMALLLLTGCGTVGPLFERKEKPAEEPIEALPQIIHRQVFGTEFFVQYENDKARSLFRKAEMLKGLSDEKYASPTEQTRLIYIILVDKNGDNVVGEDEARVAFEYERGYLQATRKDLFNVKDTKNGKKIIIKE